MATENGDSAPSPAATVTRSPRASTSTIGHSLDLPSLLPLSHQHPLLTAQEYDVDAFLLSRIHIPLDELRAELRAYLGVLREELVQLINDDYEEFISLGTGLRGEGERLKGLQRPLTGLRGQVEIVRDVLKDHQNAVQAQLDERSALREEKALLELLQRLFETLARAEALETVGDDTERPKVVQRLAGEYTQLVYLRNKARAEGCKVAETASPRIDALRTRLSHDLASILTAALGARDEPRIKQCLRTYDLIEGWREAEDVVRSLVHEFCARTITASALVVPPSPTAPETPAASKAIDRPHRLTGASLLDGLYNRVLAQVETYTPLIAIAHSVSTEFDFFSKVLWPEIGTAVVDNLGHVIFSAGRPDELYKHYTTTHRFLTIFEGHAPTADAVIAMRESRTYITFERRWQLPVYFQLRWKEIVSTFENALVASATSPQRPSTSAVSSPRVSGATGWALPQSEAAWNAFKQCWAPEIYLPELSHRFWRLSLQILSRYGSWLSATLATYKVGDDEAAQAQEDAVLRFAASAIADIDQLTARIGDLALLADLGLSVPFPASLSTQPYAERIVAVLQRRCAEPLKLVKTVASQFRATAARPNAAVTASHFIPTILKPLNLFFEPRPTLREKYQAAWSVLVVDHVLSNYASILASVRKTEDLLRRHRGARRPGFSLFGNAGVPGTPDAEEGRFKTQMLADVNALADDARKLGVSVDDLGSWLELKEVVERPSGEQ
ncbi:Conserved oligomeric Golgi complex subunit 2 [Vanrija pseudolonga]|uniref:Conserved oligomeric Golgi complex subunit 2 n=1 Tax=Vanrija pseudolonga TaxID=143232 RepID=A0AAF1BSQ4_9TREE|nr:Conserved oligomeric Golgi complex subunit 2 [Vanrija pseudolonga]